MNEVLNELAELKKITAIGVKQALDMNDASVLTGLSKSHLYKLVCSKKVPYYKCNGKLTYFDKTELTAWMLQHRVSTSSEIEAAAANRIVTGKLKKC